MIDSNVRAAKSALALLTIPKWGISSGEVNIESASGW